MQLRNYSFKCKFTFAGTPNHAEQPVIVGFGNVAVGAITSLCLMWNGANFVLCIYDQSEPLAMLPVAIALGTEYAVGVTVAQQDDLSYLMTLYVNGVAVAATYPVSEPTGTVVSFLDNSYSVGGAVMTGHEVEFYDYLLTAADFAA